MASPVSFIRSAAQDTFSAYRRVPVRWRLGGGSAALTFIILAIFAFAIGTLTTREIDDQFVNKAGEGVATLTERLTPKVNPATGVVDCTGIDLADFVREDRAQVRLFDRANGQVLCTQTSSSSAPGTPPTAPDFTMPRASGAYTQFGYRVEARKLNSNHRRYWVIYALPLDEVQGTITWLRARLVLSVVAGAVLALFAGLYVARRAMRPISELTEAAREIELTRDPSLRIPEAEAEDEIAELARTLVRMLAALDDARNESDAALARQREFVADASHELRTPLTSVLANLELLADELEGEQADSAKAALRATRRMRRLVGDLLLLARADVERYQPRRATDLADVLTDAAAELGPVAEDRELTISPEHVMVNGTSDDLHRMVLNLIENAVHHTPAGTRIRAATEDRRGSPVLVVEDNGPGIPPEMQHRVFERFVRGGGDTSDGPRGTGLGLAIVQAVADSHGATVKLQSLPELQGTRFEIMFPPMPVALQEPAAAGSSSAAAGAQTSTTTGSTIGRRRSLS